MTENAIKRNKVQRNNKWKIKLKQSIAIVNGNTTSRKYGMPNGTRIANSYLSIGRQTNALIILNAY